MSLLWFDGLLTRHEDAGVYFLPQADIDELREAAAVNQFPCLEIDLHGVRDKGGLLQRFADALHFPSHFGFNWDAFADALADFRPGDTLGLVLLLENSGRLRREGVEDFKIAMEVLQSVSAEWAGRQRPFWSFIAMSDDEFDALD
ncbi:barstar family protein [Arenimonas sp.]|uniref:barstar family protein n=1 Tax=Arenimonas sp. TaxID=1872635 RepID=UPI0039E2CECD